MIAFDLRANPFAVLGVSPRDGHDALAQALEGRLADGEIAEDELYRAQQSLTASKPRLQAEIAWLIGMAPARAKAILSALNRNDLVELEAALRSASGLLRANLAAQMAAGKPHLMGVGSLLEAQDEIDCADVTKLINAERRVAGFPEVEQSLVIQALESLRASHVEAALASVTAAEHPGKLMAELVECRLDTDGLSRDFLEALAEGYDSWSGPIVREIEERLDVAATRLRENTNDNAALQQIEADLEAWDEFSQPRQLIFQAKHMDEPRSKVIYGKLRDLTLWLANEKQCYNYALALSRALFQTFPELPSVLTQVADDIETLEGLIEESEHFTLFAELTAAVEEARKDHVELSWSIEQGNFAPGGKGVAGRLYRAFTETAARAVAHQRADLPWLMVRQLSVELHNEQQETKAALQLVVAIRRFTGAKPSVALQKRLKDDEDALRREHLWGEVATLSRQKHWTDALARVAELERLTTDAGQRRKLSALRGGIEHRKNAEVRRWIFGIGGAIAVFAILWLSNEAPKPPRSHNTPSYSSAGPSAGATSDTPDAGGTISGTSGGAFSSGSGDSYAESKPPIGVSILLNRSQIRYCLFQGERLDGLRLYVHTDAQISYYNQLVDDWNSRCSSYRYYRSDIRVVDRELLAQRTRLQAEGRRLVGAGSVSRSTPLPRGATPVGPLASGSRLLDPTGSSVDATIAQQRLAEMGFYRGPIDGIWGSGSRRALIDFRRSVGLSAEAAWNRQTQMRLFAGTAE